MNKIKTLLILLLGLVCLIPNSVVKADESDIDLASVSYTCQSCGKGTLVKYSKSYGAWFDDDEVPCTHGKANHYDVPQWRWVYDIYRCNNCGYKIEKYSYTQWQYVKCYSY